jgi:hypothetical protein
MKTPIRNFKEDNDKEKKKKIRKIKDEQTIESHGHNEGVCVNIR